MADQQKSALTSGGTSGSGRELVKLFALDKHNFVLVVRSQDELSQTASEIQQQYGAEVKAILCTSGARRSMATKGPLASSASA